MGSEGSKAQEQDISSSRGGSSHGRHGNDEKGLGEYYHHTAAASTPSIRYLQDDIRQRFRHGINYNLKMIIKGRKGSGKTTLWKRLQGMKFYQEYLETPEIQVATIDWSYKVSDDTVKVEVWDIVDQGIRTTNPDHCAKEIEANALKPLLDAQNIDVYRGTHAVIFMICPFSLESLDYARKEVHEVPSNVAIIFLLGYRDLIDPTQYCEFYLPPTAQSYPSAKIVTLRDLYQLVNEVRQRRNEPLIGSEEHFNATNTVYAAEVSLLNCWGLIELDRFFNVPFLMLKKQTLMEQLHRAEMELIQASSVLYQDEIKWSPDGQPIGVIEKYYNFSQKYGGRTGTSTIPPHLATESRSPLGDDITTHVHTPGIHEQLKQIDNYSESTSSSSPQLSVYSSSLQLVHPLSQSKTPPSSTSSGQTVIQDDSPPPSSPGKPSNEGDLDQFIPPDDHNQVLDNFFDDDEVKIKSFSPKEQLRTVDDSYEGDGSSSPPTPTGKKSLVRIKKKKIPSSL